MSFTSIRFVIFFPCIFILYYAVPFRFRKYLLLAASYYFYMCWKAEFIALIMISTAIDYFCGLGIEKYRGVKSRTKVFLLASGENRHSESGENRQFWSIENRHLQFR